MARLEVVPFAQEHVEDAARLLAARHARAREREPTLSPRYEDAAAAVELVRSALAPEGASGAAAVRGGRLAGYLLGTPRDRGVWGENVWVGDAGHATEEPEDVRDLYGFAAARWVDEGRTRHYALVPATDAAVVDAWFRLGFGAQQEHAVRELGAPVDVRVPAGFELREPREEDVEELIAVDLALPRHQRGSPVFSSLALPTEDEVREEWHSTLAGDEERVLIGLRDGRPVACWSVLPAEASVHYRGLMRPERACYLAFASTLPEARGAGIGVALTDACLAAATGEGFEAMVVDWRVTNLLASRFWPRRGFRTAFLRLYRSIP